MRNLKKVLSLVMAMAMLLSLMVVGAGAVSDFGDKDKITHTEAVNTLVTLNVINGKDDGNYDPEGSLTRAEMAKLITFVLNGGKDPVVSTKVIPTYTDIKGNWAEAYIEYCSSMGVIAGVGGGRFDPSGTLTGSQAAKMLLVAMNYDATVFKFTGVDWEVNVNREANTAKLYKDLSGMNPSVTINRDDAAQLIYNAIQSQTMHLSWGQNMATGETTQNYTLSGDSLFVDKFNGTAYEGVLAASGKDSILGVSASKDYFSIQAKKVNNTELTASSSPALNSTVQFKYVDRDLTDLMGQYVKVLYNTQDKTVYGVYSVKDKNTVVTSTTDNVSDKTTDSIKIDGEKYDTDGLVYTASKAWADKVTFIDNDGDNKLELAIVRPVSVYKVSYVGATSVTLTDKKGNYAEGSLSNKLADILYYDGMAKDDIVIGTNDPYTGKLKLTEAEIATGAIGGYKSTNSTYQIDSDWYTNQSGKTIALGNNVDYMAIGSVIYYAKVTSGATDVTNMTMVISENTGSGDAINSEQMKLMFSDGSKKTVNIASDSAAPVSGSLYTFDVKNNGDYKLTALNATMGDYTKTGSETVALNGTSAGGSYGGTQISDDAVIFLFKGQLGSASAANDGKILTGKELKTIASTKAAQAAATSVGEATDILNAGKGGYTKATNGLTKVAVAAVATTKYPSGVNTVAWPTTASSANYGYIVSAPYQTSIDGTKYMMYKVWDGENTVDYKFKTDSTTPAGVKGQVIGYDIVDDSTIKNVSSISTTSTAVKGLSGSEIQFTDAVGSISTSDIGKLDGNTTYLYVNSGAEKTEEIGVTGGSVQTAIQPQSGIYVKNVLVTANTDKTIQLIVVDVNNQIALQASEKGNLVISGGIPAGYTVSVDGVEYTANAAQVVKPGDIVKISRASDAASVTSLTVSDTTLTSGNTATPAAGSYVSYVADGSALTVAFGAVLPTANVTFALTGEDANNTITVNQSATPKTIAVALDNAKTGFTVTATKTGTQAIALAGTDASSVTEGGSGNAPTYSMSGLTAGASKSFTLTVSEGALSPIVYAVTVTVAPAAP